MDLQLAISVVVGLGAGTVTNLLWPTGPRRMPSFIDVVLLPAVTALLVGRATAAAFDDPRALTSFRDFLIVRSGVEFWPGVAAGLIAVSISAVRAGHAILDQLVILAVPSLVGYAGYEGSCIIRAECYGPSSSFGLRPEGLSTRMLPIGLAIAVVLIAFAALLRAAITAGRVSETSAVILAILTVASVRATASFWLPKLGTGMTRQHKESLAIAATSLVILCTVSLVQRDHRPAQ